jgi:cellulose synthase/poly-beta-1,6-N-acetylglucosamine synthase-like glycosyltransferase
MNNGTMRGLTTIIVPCWNEVSYTQQSVAALKQRTLPPWELIVVNNGSTDETGSYLAGVRDLAAVPVAVVNMTSVVNARRCFRSLTDAHIRQAPDRR